MSVDVAPLARETPLALSIARRVEAAIERSPRRRREFDGLWGTFVLVVDGRALSLRFDFGRLTIHAGHVGRATVTVSGTASQVSTLLGRASAWRRLARLAGTRRRSWSPGSSLALVLGLTRNPWFAWRVLALLEGAGEAVG